MARYFITLSYNGSKYNGWQIQDNTPNTVQQVLQDKMSMLLKEQIEIVGCGRTDTGVHAKYYVAHFDSNCLDLISNQKHWVYKFNTVLPNDVCVHKIEAMQYEAHARFHATERTYHYFLHQQRNPFIENLSWYVYGDLDFELMNRAALELLNYTDFTSFSKLHTQVKTNNCKVTKAVWNKCGVDQWRFSIKADRFLRGMIRAIVGTLLLVGKNKMTIDEFKKVIAGKDRKLAGNNAPEYALFLTGIRYPQNIYLKGE